MLPFGAPEGLIIFSYIGAKRLLLLEITSIMVPFAIPAESRELLSQFRETE